MLDARILPFPDASFDLVMANHILYHVPERQRALAEIARVLTSRGQFYAATNGDAHMKELGEVLRTIKPDVYEGASSDPFSLETGEEQLSSLNHA